MADDGSLWADLAADVRRVADRLRSLSEARVARPPAPSATGGPDYGSCEQAGRSVAAELARVAELVEAAVAGTEPRPRDLPRLAPMAVGDQVDVTGHDLLAALALVDPSDRVPAAAAQLDVERAAGRLADVRRRI